MKKISLLASCFLISGLSFAQTDLFISEVVEGAGANNNDKAVEIYNPSSQAIDVSQYSIRRYNNGGSTPFQDEILMPTTGGSNMLQPGDVWVIIHPDPNINPQISAVADQVSADYASNGPSVILQGGAINANGNDAYELVKWVGGAPGTAGAVAQTVDIFGKIGEDPGLGGWSGFQVGPPTTISSANHSIMRKWFVTEGVTDIDAAFDITEEWVAYSVSNYGDASLPEQNYSRLGEHADYGIEPTAISESLLSAAVRLYPNPAAGKVSVELTEDFAGSISVINTLGQQVSVEQNNLSNRLSVLNIQNLSSGLYFVNLIGKDGQISAVKSLIVQ